MIFKSNRYSIAFYYLKQKIQAFSNKKLSQNYTCSISIFLIIRSKTCWIYTRNSTIMWVIENIYLEVKRSSIKEWFLN